MKSFKIRLYKIDALSSQITIDPILQIISQFLKSQRLENMKLVSLLNSFPRLYNHHQLALHSHHYQISKVS